MCIACLSVYKVSSHYTLLSNMDQNSRPLNLIFLSIVNGLFFFAGIFLNSIVKVSLLKSKQHLKSLCSFMILVLTCVDLAVIVCHLLIIISTYIWSTEDYNPNNIYHKVKKYSNILFHFSFMALLVMNADRFLAVSYPFFHKKNYNQATASCLSPNSFVDFPDRKSPSLPNVFRNRLLRSRGCVGWHTTSRDLRHQSENVLHR